MDGESDYRKWDELIPDALGLIFQNLSLLEVLTVVPRVCKSWERVISGPYCWQEIDIEEWSKNRNPEIVDRMLRLLISRSGGSYRKVSASGLTDDQCIFIANHGQSLQTLHLPSSQITDPIMETVSEKLSTLTSIDLSYCTSIGARALEAIGKNCKSLTFLRRVMHPMGTIQLHSHEDEALAIATTMPELKHLEIAYLLVSTSSVVEILKNCKHLELLDIRGCWDVDLNKEFVKGFEGLKILGPVVIDCLPTGWDCGPSSPSYLAWDFVAGDSDIDTVSSVDELVEVDDLWGGDEYGDQVDENGFEMWFYDNYDGLELDAGFDWPQSP